MLSHWRAIHWWIAGSTLLIVITASACGLEQQAAIGLGLILLAFLPD
jgi:glutathione peroxidase-family protein